MILRARDKQILAAMRSLQRDGRELSTRNIAQYAKETNVVAGHYLRNMVRKGLVLRTGMVKTLEGNFREKNMSWRINTQFVEQLEKEDDERTKAINKEGKALAGTTGAVLKVQGIEGPGKLLVKQVRNTKQLVQSMSLDRLSKALAGVLHDNQAETGR
jgi:hypothetical protein